MFFGRVVSGRSPRGPETGQTHSKLVDFLVTLSEAESLLRALSYDGSLMWRSLRYLVCKVLQDFLHPH